MSFEQALYTFIEESRELLAEMEDSLLRVSSQAQPQECINAIFRAAHTIKGSAGLFGLDAVVAFTHVAETLLDEVRNGDVLLNTDLVQLLLACCDHMHALVNQVEHPDASREAVLASQSRSLMQALQAHHKMPNHASAHPACDTTTAPMAAPQPATPSVGVAATALGDTQDWHIAVQFGATVLQNGMDPLSFLRYLHSMGQVLHTQTLAQRLPPLEAIDAEQCYLGFVMHLRTAASQADIAAVFEFVQDDCELCITPLFDLSVCETNACTESALLSSPAASSPPSCTDLHPQPSALPDIATQPLPSASAPSQPPSIGPAASAEESVGRKPRAGEHHSVRVDAQKLDQLINLVGELIIASAGATEVARQLRQPQMLEANATLTHLVEQVRDQALQLRMVKIGSTFNKFQRVVHEVARELGKDIALHVSGEDTELDKTVVERIGDPLTHLVRNAMDHGIEPEQVRLAQGKSAQGHLHLNAFHESGQIVIEISDDGCGLDRDRILAKGIERGLVEPGRALSDKEIYDLIFEPGFSTADQITSLSGRGVGMDVVRSNIKALRGSVELLSQPGQGTTVQVRLPLTLAIINGFQVRVGHSVLVIPLEMVDACVEFSGDASRNYTELRGGVLPFVPLRQHFGIQGPASSRPNIVVIKHGNQRFGLLVDALLGEAQTVIKPLSRLFSQAQGISGTSILGNGSVALILDIPVLHQQLLAGAQAEQLPNSLAAH